MEKIILSICIATYNRSEYLFETLTCLQQQLQYGVEIIIVDGASSDNTSVVSQLFASKTDSIRYYREPKNSGVDSDFDKAIVYARGKYCWLFSDDDLLINDAISYILNKIKDDHLLLVINSSIYSKEMNYLLVERVLKDTQDKEFLDECNQAFISLGNYLSFIGAIIVKREYWLSREREIYHGSEFAHIGVLFQYPPISSIKLISEPLIMIRYGNSQWANRGFEVWVKKWPEIIKNLSGVSYCSRNIVSNNNFIGLLKFCCLYRAMGIYNIDKYNSNFELLQNYLVKFILILIAHIPAKFFNALLALSFIGGSKINIYRLLNSTSSSMICKWVARIRGIA